MPFPDHDTTSCACCHSLLQAMFDRRRFLHVAGAVGLVSIAPSLAFGAQKKKKFEAMVVSCIDPRFQKPVFRYATERGLTGQYSKFTVAGAAIGVVAPAFKDWRKAYWDNLAASIQLHNVPKVIAIDHRDCGAAKIAYGEAKVANPQIETQTNKTALLEFRKEVTKRHPKLQVELHLMALDGTVETFS